MMKKQHVKLSSTDREALKAIVSKPTVKASAYKRATYLLSLDAGGTYKDIAKRYSVSSSTLTRLAESYQSRGLACLEDKSRSGRPPEIDGLQRAKLTALASSTPPEGYARWSLRLLADKAVELGYFEHLSHDHARTILKKTIYSPIVNAHGVLA